MNQYIASLAVALFAAAIGKADGVSIHLGTPFADHAILQREMKVPVWGRAVGGDGAVQKVKVEFAGQN